MFVPRTVQAFLPDVNSVADEFIERLDKIKDPQSGYVDNFSNEVAKWNLECMSKSLFFHLYSYLVYLGGGRGVKRREGQTERVL